MNPSWGGNWVCDTCCVYKSKDNVPISFISDTNCHTYRTCFARVTVESSHVGVTGYLPDKKETNKLCCICLFIVRKFYSPIIRVWGLDIKLFTFPVAKVICHTLWGLLRHSVLLTHPVVVWIVYVIVICNWFTYWTETVSVVGSSEWIVRNCECSLYTIKFKLPTD